jgi:hypothetical protein
MGCGRSVAGVLTRALPACTARWLRCLGFAVVGAAVLGACRRRAEPPPGSAAPVPSAPSEVAAVDKALDGELAEGDEKAFGLALPREMKVKARLQKDVVAIGDVAINRLVEYLQARVSANHLETTVREVTLDQVTVRGQPGTLLHIEILPKAGLTQLALRDITPPKVREGLTDEERWRAVGMYPNGRLIDPTHLK